MRIFNRCLLVALFVALVSATGYAQIVNGDFEGGLSGWSWSGLGWSWSEEEHWGMWAKSNFLYAMVQTSDPGLDEIRYQEFAVEAHAKISGWAFFHAAADADNDSAFVRIRDAVTGVVVDATWYRDIAQIGPSQMTGWEYWEYEFPVGGIYRVEFGVRAADPSYGSWSFIGVDGISLTNPVPTGPLTNRGFETGDLTGWSGSGAHVVAGYHTYGPYFAAPAGTYFAVVPGGCPTATLYQRFSAQGGTRLFGWAFFQANDYPPFNDTGKVKLLIESPAGEKTLFSSSVQEVGTYGNTEWTPWTYTFPTDGVYEIRVESTNDRDCIGSSVVGIDIRMNSAPVLDPISGVTTQWGDAVSFTATATDADLPADSLTYSLSGAPDGAMIVPSTGEFHWTPTGLQIGTHTFSVVVSDHGLPSLSDSQEITIEVTKRATTLVYTGETNGQYSDPVTLSAVLTDAGSTNILDGTMIDFAIGAQVDHAVMSGGSASVVVTLNQAAQTTTASATYAETEYFFGSFVSVAFAINKEDVSFTLSSDNPTAVKVSTPGGTSPSVTLCATFEEAADGSLGDLSLAPVTFAFTPVAGGAGFKQNAAITGSGTTRTACVSTSGLAVDAYDITIAVGGNYYTGAAYTVLAVYDPSLGFTTGGGTVTRDGVKANFAFNVKYLKNGNVQGGALYIEHRPTGDLRIKSNAMGSLSIVDATAVIVTKATLGEVGNQTMIVTGIDNGEPGVNSDQFGLLVKNAAGVEIPEVSFAPMTISGGNIQVPHKAKGK